MGEKLPNMKKPFNHYLEADAWERTFPRHNLCEFDLKEHLKVCHELLLERQDEYSQYIMDHPLFERGMKNRWNDEVPWRENWTSEEFELLQWGHLEGVYETIQFVLETLGYSAHDPIAKAISTLNKRRKEFAPWFKKQLKWDQSLKSHMEKFKEFYPSEGKYLNSPDDDTPINLRVDDGDSTEAGEEVDSNEDDLL